MSDPYGGRPWPSPGAAGRPPSGRPPRWATVGLPVALATLIAVVVIATLVDGRGSADPVPGSSDATGSAVPASGPEGEWAGEGTLIRCAGFDDGGCAETRPITLTIDCSGTVCEVTPFDGSYGSPPLEFADGRYRAAGPVPPDVAPTCGGVPTSSALWRLELAFRAGRLGGNYAEATVQGFDCGATGVAWKVVFERT